MTKSHTLATRAQYFIVSESGLADWRRRLDENITKRETLLKEFGTTRPGVGPQAGRRNELERQLAVLEQRITDARFVIDNHRIAEPNHQSLFVAIGNTIVIQRLDEDGEEIGGPETYEVGEYGSTDTHASPPILSYDSLVIRAVLGYKVGDEPTTPITLPGNKKQYIELLKILPPTPHVRAAAA